jgi:hypothetical protein
MYHYTIPILREYQVVLSLTKKMNFNPHVIIDDKKSVNIA